MHIVFVDSNMVGLGALRAARQAGHFVTFVRSNRFAAFIQGVEMTGDPQYCDQVVQIESSLDEEELMGALSQLKRNGQLDAVITVLDFCTHVVARCAARLGVPGTRPDAVALAQDKAACRAHIAERGIRSVPFALVGDLESALARASEIGYPVIAKPKRGAASLLTAKIEAPEQMRAYFASLDRDLDVPEGVIETLSEQTLIEGYATGPLFSVEIAAAGGDYRAMALSWRKRCSVDPSVELGTTIPAPVGEATAESLKDYALTVVRSLGLDLGIFHVELIQGEHGPVLVEVNPRIMGNASQISPWKSDGS
ncbi:ATP-grasp domain-containing protein [Paracidovorax anthurii]|uniref:ATP-grasp domain-containing protein n=1 Tax=Paracidovorax anthurii TaxID=78229 RepID=A0A328Z7D5_9BURK|nr:ATP-grasp domain-containing protein [Paracidovorax anthurii]RAR81353.1 ATP-grasp domain-containing protein [Paracidovorax anthurii]